MSDILVLMSRTRDKRNSWCLSCNLSNLTVGFVSAEYVCVGVFTFFLTLLSLSSFYSLDTRQKEGAPHHRGTFPSLPPPSLPAVLMVGLQRTGYMGGKEAKMEK